MNILRGITLFFIAVLTAKVLYTSIFVLVAISQLITELAGNEQQRIIAYRIIISYSALVVSLALVNAAMIYSEVNRKNTLKWSYISSPIAVLLYGSHLAYAYLFGIEIIVLDDFAKGYFWLPIIGLIVTVVLHIIALKERVHLIRHD